jgi:hypothetical protein
MRILLILLIQFTFCSLYGQNEITFKEALKIVATEKINSEIKKGAVLSATSIYYSYNDGFPIITVNAKNLDGSSVGFEPKKLNLFEFKDVDNIDKIWDKHQLTSGTY